MIGFSGQVTPGKYTAKGGRAREKIGKKKAGPGTRLFYKTFFSEEPTLRLRGDFQVSLITLQDRLLLQYDPFYLVRYMLKIVQHFMIGLEGQAVPPHTGISIHAPDPVEELEPACHPEVISLSQSGVAINRQLVILDHALD